MDNDKTSATVWPDESVQLRTIGGGEMLPRGAADDANLERLGKRPVLRRSFGFLTILGFSCTVLTTWEATLFVFTAGLQNGGPSGIVYGYILVWAGMLATFTTLGEMCSMAPTSGGQYHFVAILAPPALQRPLSYVTGWLTLTGWQALLASGMFLTGNLLQSIIILTHPEYAETRQTWHAILMAYAILILIYGINTSFNSLFAKFEGFAFIIHILGFFGIMLPLVFLSEKATNEQVFETFTNMGGWPSQGLAFCIGVMGTVFSFLGGDGAIHMAEETRNVSLTLPRSLLTTLMVNGTLGFAMLITLLYCMGDLDAAVAEDPNFPFLAILRRATNSPAAATAMSSILVVMNFAGSTGCVSSTSRIYFALSRDRAIPGWRIFKKTSPRTSIPRWAVLVTVVLAALLIACSLLLWQRLSGGIDEPDLSKNEITNTMGTRLTWGPWRVRGKMGAAINALSCAYLFFIFFFSFWPVQRVVTPATMNWGVLVMGVVSIFSIVYYYTWARGVFKGPLVEI
ncbi:amino acid transporter-like protein [Xylariomycetidae sp. FL0641]|nr:amino acid transporter-like protein [Xylariomycetidae sp. FL0641]